MVSCRDLPRNGFFVVAQHPAFIPKTVHFHAALSVHAHQNVVILALDPILADNIALMEPRKLGRIQFGLAYFADVADHMRGQTVLGVEPMLDVNYFQLRETCWRLCEIRRRRARRA